MGINLSRYAHAYRDGCLGPQISDLFKAVREHVCRAAPRWAPKLCPDPAVGAHASRTQMRAPYIQPDRNRDAGISRHGVRQADGPRSQRVAR